MLSVGLLKWVPGREKSWSWMQVDTLGSLYEQKAPSCPSSLAHKDRSQDCLLDLKAKLVPTLPPHPGSYPSILIVTPPSSPPLVSMPPGPLIWLLAETCGCCGEEKMGTGVLGRSAWMWVVRTELFFLMT